MEFKIGTRARLKVIGVRGGVGWVGVGMKAPVASGIWDFFLGFPRFFLGPRGVFSRLGGEIEPGTSTQKNGRGLEQTETVLRTHEPVSI